MSGVVRLVAYVVMVLGAASVLMAGYVIWTDPSGPWRTTWRPWLLLTAGGTALCLAVALL